MAVHRYWRIYCTTGWAQQAGGTIGSVIMKAAPGGANLSVTGNGTPSASSNFDSVYTAAKAFLGDETPGIDAQWLTLPGQVFPHWLAWDFGAGNEKWIGELTLWCPSSTLSGYVKDFSFQHSDNGTTWVTAMSGTTSSNTASTSTTFLVPEPASITMNVSAPAPTIYAYCGANSATAAPSPTFLAVGGGIGADLTAPATTLYSTARSSAGDNDFTYTAPSPTLSAFGGASAELKAPSASLNITATVVNFGSAALKAPSAALSASGTTSATAYADLTFGYVNGGSYDLVGYGGAVASITLTGSPTIQATGTTGSIGGAQITAPLFELTASGTAQNWGSANLLAPSAALGATAQVWLVAPSATLMAIGTAVVTATFEAYAVNLNHTPKRGVEPVDETTRYTNFPFTHVVRYKNSYYGANSTGLYLLEGTTDNGTPIPWAFETAITDFKSPNKKTLASAYFSGRFGTSSTIQLKKGEKSPITHAFTTPRGTLAQNHRQVFGKDRAETRTRYFALAASGTSEFELDAIECDVHNTTRRI